MTEGTRIVLTRLRRRRRWATARELTFEGVPWTDDELRALGYAITLSDLAHGLRRGTDADWERYIRPKIQRRLAQRVAARLRFLIQEGYAEKRLIIRQAPSGIEEAVHQYRARRPA